MKQYLRFMVLSCLVILGAGATLALAKNAMADFGLKENMLKQQLVDALVNGHLPAYPDRKVYKAAAPALQAAVMKETLSWVKAYTASAAFKADYAKQRASAKPLPAATKGTPDEQYDTMLAEQRQGIETMKKNMASMPPEVRQQMQEAIKQMEANVQRTAKDQQMKAMLKQGFEQNKINDQKNHQERIAAWEKKYPSDPNVLLAARLHEFLTLSQDVAFNARLVPGPGGKLKFADAKYEAKSDEWKLCFRAGREPVLAARAFAQDWLSELK